MLVKNARARIAALVLESILIAQRHDSIHPHALLCWAYINILEREGKREHRSKEKKERKRVREMERKEGKERESVGRPKETGGGLRSSTEVRRKGSSLWFPVLNDTMVPKGAPFILKKLRKVGNPLPTSLKLFLNKKVFLY